MGLIGAGFISAHHIDAVRRLGDVEVIAIADWNQETADRRARELKVDRAYGRFEDLIADPEISVIHNTTPNHLHYPVSSMIIAAGKHVISDKPLALNSAEALLLRDAALRSGRAHILNFNYRSNPVVQHARSMVTSGELGELSFIHGHYLQDWLTDPSVYSWRSDPAKGGASSALGDIGSHWCDLAQHVSGAKITAVLADLAIVVPVRYMSDPSRQAFARDQGPRGEPVQMVSEDLASVLIRFDNGARGCLSVGQVLPGHKNDLMLELNGRSQSLRWLQEQPNELWVGRYGEPNLTVTKDPAQLSASAERYSRLPAGHQVGWSDALFNAIADAYDWIRAGGGASEKPAATATFEDGYRIACVIDAMLQSHVAGGVWQKVEYTPAPAPLSKEPS
jgi:predicted dehydrogenase